MLLYDDRVTKVTQSEIIWTPAIGDNIHQSCVKISLLAAYQHTEVVMDFNGIEIRATPKTSAPELESAWRAESIRRYQAYVNSPEYTQRQEEVRILQERKDAILEKKMNGPSQ